jgi:hypothetical protein
VLPVLAKHPGDDGVRRPEYRQGRGKDNRGLQATQLLELGATDELPVPVADEGCRRYRRGWGGVVDDDRSYTAEDPCTVGDRDMSDANADNVDNRVAGTDRERSHSWPELAKPEAAGNGAAQGSDLTCALAACAASAPATATKL